MSKNTETGLEPLGVQIPAACKLIGCGKTKLYELVNEGELELVKIGARSTITMSSIKRYYARLLSQQSQAA